MKKTYLIADSGGTQTDWCFVDENQEKHYFTTSSFHPSQWNDQFINDFSDYWSKHSKYKSSNLYFYGAGCLNEKNNLRMKEIFHKWGFLNINVLSDLEGACHAALINKPGFVAILGTGSVVCEYDGDSIINIKGGFGYLIGDEGSGYYFGRLVLQKILNKEFSKELENQLIHLFGDRTSIISSVYGDFGKQFIGTVASKLGELNFHEEIKNLHFENIHSFFSKYLELEKTQNKKLSVIGRYGKNQTENLKKCARNFGWEIENFIDAPIFLLTDYVLLDTL